ncbi:MAG: M24 family metallopeptidase, partial [Bdellovibrionales bacterium]
LVDLHLLPKSKTGDKTLRKYSPHSVGHLLGLDVHDPYTKNKKNLILKKGMVLTIEPGIYFSKNETLIPKDLKGAGFRIEDNILVTSSGYKVLTHRIPKEVKDIERLCSKKV